MPSGKPLQKIATTLRSAGKTAKQTSAASAARIKNTSIPALRPGRTSGQTLMPMYLDAV